MFMATLRAFVDKTLSPPDTQGLYKCRVCCTRSARGLSRTHRFRADPPRSSPSAEEVDAVCGARIASQARASAHDADQAMGGGCRGVRGREGWRDRALRRQDDLTPRRHAGPVYKFGEVGTYHGT